LDRRYDFVGLMEKHVQERSVLDFEDRIPFWYQQLCQTSLKQSILEIGCSHGGFLKYCRDNGFKRCVGVELNEGTCDFARNTFNIEMICGDFPDVEINEKFDIVCGFDLLEHLSDPLKALRKMASLSNKYVMIQIPVYSDEELSAYPYFDAGIHLFLLSEKAIGQLFGLAGIKIILSVPGAFRKNLTMIGEKL
jgi:SAM-dependent methyltransferase